MRVRLLAGLTIMVLATGAWLSVPALAQNQTKGRGASPADKQQQQEAQALMQYVQDVMTGSAVPPDATLMWRPFFVKSQGNQVYVPFTVMLDPGKLAGKQVAMYYSVTPKGPRVSTFIAKEQEDGDRVNVDGEVTNSGAAAAENVKVSVNATDGSGKVLATQSGVVSSVPAGGKATFTVQLKKPRNATQYTASIEGAPQGFRDFAVVDLPTAAPSQPVRLSRAFAAAAGEYDVHVVLRERPEPNPKAAPKIALLNESVSVPDMGAQLTTSSIFVAEKIDALSAPLNREEQLKQPFTLGTMAIVPSTSTTVAKSGELSIIFFVYNAGVDASSKKPNVEVEYNFHQKTNEGEKFFNKTNPQQFNAETLPPQFDIAQGHQLVGGQSVPLASFAPGEYRLEIKVTDKTSGRSLTRNLPFTVAPS